MEFREMMRYKQQLPQEECIRILKEELRGVLSVLGDGDYPYGMPLNHYYCEEDGKLYFHSGKKGHRTDAMRRHDKASFCVYDSGFRKEGEWALNINSVIIFGRMRFVEDEEKKREICAGLCRKFTDDEAYLQKELDNDLRKVCCLELEIEHMTGKLVNEA